MLLLAVFKVLLYRYTGQKDICVGRSIANRQYRETEGFDRDVCQHIGSAQPGGGRDKFTRTAGPGQSDMPGGVRESGCSF